MMYTCLLDQILKCVVYILLEHGYLKELSLAQLVDGVDVRLDQTPKFKSLSRRIFACFFLIKKLSYVGQGFLIDILSFLGTQIYRKWGPTRDYHQIYSTISTVF